jgi:hypothetical protein
LDELYQIAETTFLETRKAFCDVRYLFLVSIFKLSNSSHARLSQIVLDEFETEYLPPMDKTFARELCKMHEVLGWPGLLGSLDCSHWLWAKCPKSLQGEFKKDKAAPSVVYECACDADLRIWHCNFALPGACNDLNVLDASPILDMIGNGDTLSTFLVEGNIYHQPYILVSTLL